MSDSNAIKKTISLIDKLQSDHGCPWVKELTFENQFNELKKEIKEVENAVANKDIENLKEEVGDVLWDVLTLIKISEKEYNFKIEDILENVCEKIIRRKPYVFGNEKAETSEQALAIWNRVKKEENSQSIK